MKFVLIFLFTLITKIYCQSIDAITSSSKSGKFITGIEFASQRTIIHNTIDDCPEFFLESIIPITWKADSIFYYYIFDSEIVEIHKLNIKTSLDEIIKRIKKKEFNTIVDDFETIFPKIILNEDEIFLYQFNNIGIIKKSLLDESLSIISELNANEIVHNADISNDGKFIAMITSDDFFGYLKIVDIKFKKIKILKKAKSLINYDNNISYANNKLIYSQNRADLSEIFLYDIDNMNEKKLISFHNCIPSNFYNIEVKDKVYVNLFCDKNNFNLKEFTLEQIFSSLSKSYKIIKVDK